MNAPNLIGRYRADGPHLHEESHHPEAKDPSTSEHSEHEHGFEWTELARIVIESSIAILRSTIQSLLDFLPRTATVRRNGEVLEITSDQVGTFRWTVSCLAAAPLWRPNPAN